MTKPVIVEESSMNIAQVKDELAKIKKRDGELNFRSNKTDEYLQQIDVISKTKAKELYDKIVAMQIPRVKDVHINKVVDLLPKTADQLKVILQGYTLTVKAENQKKIIETVIEVVGK